MTDWYKKALKNSSLTETCTFLLFEKALSYKCCSRGDRRYVASDSKILY